MRIGVIRVVTTGDDGLLGAHGRVIEAELGVETVSRCLPDQPDGVHDDATFALAAAKVPELAARMEREDGVAALLVSCAADPGLAGARAAVGVPVVGAGEAAARRALELGSRVGVLDLTTRTPAAVTSVLGPARVAALVPEGVRSTHDLRGAAGLAASVRAAERLVALGADTLMFACTGMTTIGLAAHLAERVEVPVVDAVRAGARAAVRAAGG
ncbi:aspartate/glutamate racemase family protein [Streptomonospora nanhaiensis]|uniref:Asp/Glu/hydantoin racemase n=1 Tax=Streptomonospora nanhaiensis TaxID=1323731 RepID=A0A853BUD7_9ACTN|nr:aspartate/glutamate racemase family protein [Streptomonospora nanhaiensis]MBV2366519.1 hydantoin racemase [Streptomonospora nanhaiensis]MBX9391485.1 aspartate/glutamate racemase family protein [Streptomonospora nanhaiensis]NYI98365.1 Asp/Glu/hydantoin racemase [Streptomonospora nanhaiensis]